MRKSIDGLCSIISDTFHMDPAGNALYLFCGKRCDRIKAILREPDGFCLLYKRLDVQSGRFRWPRNSKEVRQLNIFNEAEQEQDASLELEFPEDMLAPEEETKPRKPKRTHAETFKGIPVKKEVIPLPEDEKQCPNCGTDLVRIGEEFVRNEFRFTPAKGELVRIYRETWKCPACTDEAATDGVDYFFKNATVPPPLLPGSYASASVVAWIMFQKYVEAVPLYRQETTWKQLGVPLLRATMGSWMIRCAEQYLKPLYDYLHRCLLKREFLMADETRVQVLKEPGRAAETDSFMWLFRSGEDGLDPIILFHYTETRKKANAVDFLKGSSGYLMCDGYQGYNDLPDLKRCICYSHIRRYFVDAVPKGKELDLSNAAVQGVYYCNKLLKLPTPIRCKPILGVGSLSK